MSSTTAARVGELDAGVAWTWPPEARSVAATSPPALDVSALAGARVTDRRGWEGPGGLSVAAACVRGPSDRWMPGADSLLLERATFLAFRAFAEPSADAQLTPSASRREGEVVVQPLEGSSRDGAHRVRGAHHLFFVGEEAEVVVCTYLCAEPATQRACDAIATGAHAYGAIVPEPPPGFVASAAVWAFENPTAALAVGAAIAVLAIAVLLRFRPRPRA